MFDCASLNLEHTRLRVLCLCVCASSRLAGAIKAYHHIPWCSRMIVHTASRWRCHPGRCLLARPAALTATLRAPPTGALARVGPSPAPPGTLLATRRSCSASRRSACCPRVGAGSPADRARCPRAAPPPPHTPPPVAGTRAHVVCHATHMAELHSGGGGVGHRQHAPTRLTYVSYLLHRLTPGFSASSASMIEHGLAPRSFHLARVTRSRGALPAVVTSCGMEVLVANDGVHVAFARDGEGGGRTTCHRHRRYPRLRRCRGCSRAGRW